MRVTGLKGDRLYSLRLADYLIDWDRHVSKPQKLVKEFLHRYWKSHVVGEEVRVPGSRCRIDLINFTRRIAVEVSPSSSHSFNLWMHKDRNRFGAGKQRELDKQAWAERNGFAYIELGDDDIGNLSPKLFADCGIVL